MKRFTHLLLFLLLNSCFVFGQSKVCPTCALGYPDNSNAPRSTVAFNESDVLQTAELVPGSGSKHTTIRVWYNDEHALTLGVRSVVVKSKTGSVTTTPYDVTPSPASPTCVTSPKVGSTTATGDQAPNDVAAGGGRPLYPALFVTDLTLKGATSRAGDWQQGGMPIPPSRVCGTWKAAVKTVDYTKTPAVVTITPDADPAKNGWNIGSGDAPAAGFASLGKEGYGAEVVWDVDDLGLIVGHSYRFQVMVHDGDQNKAGGDAGEQCFSVVVPDKTPPPSGGGEQCFVSPTIPNIANAKTVWTINADNTVTIRTTFAKTFVDNTYGTNAIGWGNKGHKFNDLVGSDHLQLALYDASGTKKTEFSMDYITASNTVPSGYTTLGVKGGDGKMITGSEADIISVKTSLSEDFNTYNYSLTTNSPATDSNYTANPTYPNWIYDVWYEVKVNLSVFGSAGFGYPRIAEVHASPSKTGNNSETVNPGPCPAKLRLGNQVWNDKDGDGKRDANEPGIAGVTVSLYTDNNGDNLPDGAAIKTTMTDKLGQYLFTDLPEGRYIASIPIIPGYQQSPNNTTGGIVGATNLGCCSFKPDEDVDDDNNLIRLVGPNGPGGVVYTNAITLTAGHEPTNDGDDADGNLTFDLAECGNSGIGDFVWNDTNGNGIQDAGEHGINGILVTITFEDGRQATVLTHNYNATTNANSPELDGYYDFINLGPGTYKITFGTPMGLHSSPALQGTDRSKDSNPVDGAPVTVTLAANKSDFTIDAGFTDKTIVNTCPNLSLGNMVFNDANGNGLRDANEQGIGGLTVKLYAASGNTISGPAISTLMTAADGTYYFGNLAAGKYIVGVTTGSTYTIGLNGNGNPDDNVDNDNNGITTVNGEVRSNAITLSAGDEPINDGSNNNSNLTLDFGLKMGTTPPPPCTNHCECHNDCDHNDDHPNCGHNKCHNDCDHKDNHPNCGHNSCKNDCNHTTCGHPNCSHNSCKNDCKHTDCGHPNCSHNSCKNDCKHTDCGHKNCGKKADDKSRTATTDAQSVVAAITTPEVGNTSVTVFPNPANDFIVMKVMAAKSGIGLARITDLSGKLVTTKKVTISNGMNLVKFDQLQGLRAGTYYVQLDFNYHTYNQQLVVVK